VPGHSDIDGNETAEAYAKEAAIPENEEALPSRVDRFTFLSHISRKTTVKKWKQANEWFHLKCRSKKHYRLDEMQHADYLPDDNRTCIDWTAFKTDSENGELYLLVVSM
jgi:hypothetical protein